MSVKRIFRCSNLSCVVQPELHSMQTGQTSSSMHITQLSSTSDYVFHCTSALKLLLLTLLSFLCCWLQMFYQSQLILSVKACYSRVYKLQQHFLKGYNALLKMQLKTNYFRTNMWCRCKFGFLTIS